MKTLKGQKIKHCAVSTLAADCANSQFYASDVKPEMAIGRNLNKLNIKAL
jgi:hypothetical protein